MLVGIYVGFSRCFSRFPLPHISFHHFSTLISFISFHFISSAPVMVRQAWSVGILPIHRSWTKGLHRLSSLDPALCRTRVEDIYLFYLLYCFFYNCVLYLFFNDAFTVGLSVFLLWTKTLKGLIFNPCGEFRWRPEDPVSKIYSTQLHDASLGSFQIF